MGRDPSTLFPPRRLSICGSVHPSVRPSLFCTTRSFKRFPKPRRERERDQLATRTRAAAAVLGRRQRRPWPGEGPERMRLRANWKLVFPLSLPSSHLLSAPLPLVFAQTRKPRSLPFCCLWASLPPRRPHAHGLSVRVSVHANSRPTKNNCLLTPDAASISSSLPGLITFPEKVHLRLCVRDEGYEGSPSISGDRASRSRPTSTRPPAAPFCSPSCGLLSLPIISAVSPLYCAHILISNSTSTGLQCTDRSDLYRARPGAPIFFPFFLPCRAAHLSACSSSSAH